MLKLALLFCSEADPSLLPISTLAGITHILTEIAIQTIQNK